MQQKNGALVYIEPLHVETGVVITVDIRGRCIVNKMVITVDKRRVGCHSYVVPGVRRRRCSYNHGTSNQSIPAHGGATALSYGSQ